MSTFPSADPARTAEPRALQPSFEELSQNSRLLIRLRWVAGFGIISGTLFAKIALKTDLQILPLLLTGLIVLGYNSLLARASYTTASQNERTLRRAQQIAWGQIILDWLAMTILVHFTGGITSPALIYFVIHAALSGTILLPWQTRSLTLLAILIVSGLALLERAGLIPHVGIDELGLDDNLHQNTTYMLAVVFFFGTTLLTLSELVTYIAQRLRQREERIRQLYEARATFVRVATHELRAPLAAGLSLMKNIEQGYAGEFTDQQGAIIQRVIIRLDGLRTLIDDLLTLAVSREASTAQAPLEPVSIRAMLDKMIEREAPQAEHKKLVLDCHLSDEPGITLAGDVGLQIIFGNLLNNAVKYTPEGGRVEIEYTVVRMSRAGSAVIKIADSGIGIPIKDLPNIFNEFFRAQNAKNAQVSGTGIGLATVKTLVERYKGSINLESEEGKGTTVTVSLPLAPKQSQN